MNRFLIFALLSVCVCAELFKRPNFNFNQRLNLNKLKRQIPAKEEHARHDKRAYSYFRPALIPCTGMVTIKQTITPKSETKKPRSCDYTLYKAGELISLTGLCNDSTSETILVRGDLKYEAVDKYGDTVSYYPVAHAVKENECECEDDELLQWYRVKDLISDMLYDLDDDLEFGYDTLTEETIDGVLYYVFTGERYSDEKNKYYVDKNKFIMRLEHEDEDEIKVSVFNYISVDNLDKNLFKLNETLFPDCCSNESFKKAPEKVEPCWYIEGPDAENFYYTYMYCNFTLETTTKIGDFSEEAMKINGGQLHEGILFSTETSNTKKIYRYDMVREVPVSESGSESEYDDEEREIFPIFTGENGECKYSEGDLVDLYIVYYAVLGPYIFAGEADDEPFYVKESVTCGKEKCTMYCMNSSKLLCVTYKNTETHDPVSFDFSTSLFEEGDKYHGMRISVQYSKLSKLSDDNAFKLDKKKYPGCQAEAYEAPAISCYVDDSNVIQLTPLPCSFVMKVQKTKIEDGEEEITNYTLALNSELIGFYSRENDGGLLAVILRNDLRKYARAYSDSYCYEGTSYSTASRYFHSQLDDLYYDFEDYYDSKTKVTIDGVEYTLYNISGRYNKAVYTDKDGYLAKVETYDYDDEEIVTYVYKYDFTNADMSIFKLDKEIFPECVDEQVDEGFYEEPAKIPCDRLTIHDPSKTMCAFRIETTAQVIDGSEVEVSDYMMYVSYKDRNKLPVLTIEDLHNNSKTSYRADLPQPPIFSQSSITVVPAYTGENGVCSFSYITRGDYTNLLGQIFSVFLDEFTYVTKEEVDCGNDKCTRYCEDLANTTCVTVLNSKPPHVLKYETEYMNITYGVPVELKDFDEFTLDKSKFPGCEDKPNAYEKPKIKCSDSSSSAMLKPTVFSVCAIGAVILAVASSLF